MTPTSLVTAVAVGLILGVLGRFAIAGARQVPFWLPAAAAVGASVLATIIVRMAGVDRPGLTAVELVVQVVFAACGIAAVAITADRRPPSAHFERNGGLQ